MKKLMVMAALAVMAAFAAHATTRTWNPTVKESDGKYYWSNDNNWLDENGNTGIPATGEESEKKKPDPDKKKESENKTEDSTEDSSDETVAHETVTQTDKNTSNKSAPTGDEADFVLWIVLAIAAAGGLAAAVLNKRKI